MEEGRLPTSVFVGAQLRQCSVSGIPAFVIHKGDERGGMVLLKLNRMGPGCELLTQMRNLDGVMGWMRALKGELVPEAQADEYIHRQISRDPDIWVIEIETPDGSHPFPGPVFG